MSKYYAFISYSHLDKKWGEWLHQEMEKYKFPTKLVGEDCSIGKIPKSLFPVFLDQEETSVSTDLSTTLQKALRDSLSLIVVCSPNSAKSSWVNEEVLQFIRMGRSDRIFLLIVSGEPNTLFYKGILLDEECFPEALRISSGSKNKQPIAADLRRNGDGRKNALIKLVAGVIGVPYSFLRKREDIAARSRMLRNSVIFSLGLILVTYSFYIYIDLDDNLSDAAQAKLNSDFEQAVDKGSKRIRDLFALKAGDHKFRWSKQAIKNTWFGAKTPYKFEFPGSVNSTKFNKFAEVVSSSDGGFVAHYAGDFEPVAFAYIESQALDTAWRFGKHFAVGSQDGYVRVYNRYNNLLASLEHKTWVSDVDFIKDGEMLISVAFDSIYIWDTSKGDWFFSNKDPIDINLLTELNNSGRIIFFEYSDQENIMVTGTENQLTVWELPSGNIISKRTGKFSSFSLSRKDSLVAIADNSKIFLCEIRDIENACRKIWETPDNRSFVEFNPSNNNLLIGLENNAIILDNNYKQKAIIESPGSLKFKISSDGNWVASIAGIEVRIFSADTGKTVSKALTHSNLVHSIDFSVSSHYLTAATTGNELYLWKLGDFFLKEYSPILEKQFTW